MGIWVAEMIVIAGCLQQCFNLKGLSIQVFITSPPKVFNVPIVRKPSQWIAVGWSFCSFLISRGYLNLGTCTCTRVFLILNLLLSHCGSSALTDVSSQFSSWGWDRTRCLGFIHLKCGNVSEQCFSQANICTVLSWDYPPPKRDLAIAHISLCHLPAFLS